MEQVINGQSVLLPMTDQLRGHAASAVGGNLGWSSGGVTAEIAAL